MSSLETLAQDVESQKYSCQASRVSGSEELTSQVAALSTADKKKVNEVAFTAWFGIRHMIPE